MVSKTKTIVIGSATGITTLIGLFLLLSMSGAIITSSGDIKCRGDYSNPCISYINITTNQTIKITNPEGIKLSFTPEIKSFQLYKLSGKNWVKVDFLKNFTFTKNTLYQFKIVGYKNNPFDNIKWSINANGGFLDPFWNATNTPTAYYAFDGNANDVISGNNGVDGGNVTYSTAIKRVGTASRLGGTINVLTNINNTNAWAFDRGNFTIAFWINESTDVTGGIIGRGTYTNWSIEAGGTDSADKGKIRMFLNTTKVVLSTSTVNNSGWHHVVFSRNTADNKTYLWIDSVQEGTSIASNYNMTSSLNITIGMTDGAPYKYYIDELYVSKSFATQDLVNYLYANGSYGPLSINLSVSNFSRNVSAELGSLINILANMSFRTVCLDFNHPSYGVNYVCNATNTSFVANVTWFRTTNFNDSLTDKNLSYTGNQNLSFGIIGHQYDELLNLSINLTGLSNGSFPSGVKIYVNNTLTNDLGYISNGLLLSFNDSSTSKNISLFGGSITTVGYFKIAKSAIVIPNSTMMFNGTTTLKSVYNFPVEPYIVVEALSWSQLVTNNCNITNITSPVDGRTLWVIYDYNSSDSYDVKRSRIYTTLMSYITTASSVSKISTTDQYGVGKYMYDLYAVSYNYGHNGYYPGIVTANIVNGGNISAWFDAFVYYPGGNYGGQEAGSRVWTPYWGGSAVQSYSWGAAPLLVIVNSSVGVDIGSGDSSTYTYVHGFFLTDAHGGNINFTTSGIADMGYHDFTVTYGYPVITKWSANYTTYNPWMKVGLLLGNNDWNYTGSFTGLNISNDFASSINLYLTSCTADSNGYCNVPIYFYSDYEGALQVYNISINYTFNVNPMKISISYVRNFLNHSVNYTSIPITVHSDTNGTITVNDIRYDYRGGNKTYVVTAHTSDYSSSQNLSITYYYSKWGYNLPLGTNYIEFIPQNGNSKNVSPYRQLFNLSPILNITTYNYNQPLNLSIYLNESYSCVNLSYKNLTSNKIQILNGSWNNLSTSISYLSNLELWLYADYGCNTSVWRLWQPDLSLRACCYQCDVCDAGLI